jgi:hypothetical protein
MTDLSFHKPTTTSLSAQWALERAETILTNMAEERSGFWDCLLGRRWPVNHEPLRSDARNALPDIRRAIEKLKESR